MNDKSTVQFDLYGTYTLVPWAGNNILVETKIQLFNSSASILKHFVEKDQRYLIEEDTTNNGILRLFSHDMKRATLRSKSGVTSTEEIETKIYIPEKYVIKDEKTIVLDEPKN
ncbi:MAG: hypothetical protein GC192_02305 [Bacteroidetes bacterium]|nr:hypothetical protein [Bacteroidota bacterium]